MHVRYGIEYRITYIAGNTYTNHNNKSKIKQIIITSSTNAEYKNKTINQYEQITQKNKQEKKVYGSASKDCVNNYLAIVLLQFIYT